MKKNQILVALSVTLIGLGLAGTADAALVPRLGGQAYYDDVADLTWLADANYAQTSGYDADGFMTWQVANDWAVGLDVVGVTGWRLATTDPAVRGLNQTGSEMGDLFYNVLGGSVGSSITTTHNANYDLFSHVHSDIYWSATEYASNVTNAWLFIMRDGFQDIVNKKYSFYGWAVQSGDVGAVPVPAAVWLFGSGLLGLIGVARRKSVNV